MAPRLHFPLALLLWATPAPASAAESPWNVLILTVDCLRPDHLSLYGYERETSPELDRFASEAWVFEQAVATSAWTSPGIVSMLTGYYPPVHAQNARHSRYDGRMPSPLRILKERGYATFGRSATGANYGGLGLDEEVADLSFDAFVRARAADPERQPFFAWLHSKEPHLPYTPSAVNAGRWSGALPATPGVDAVRKHYLILRHPPADLAYEHAGSVRFVPGDAERIRALYDETVRDADDHLGRAFAALRETALLEQTIVVVSSDHGEELLEHGWVGHASTSYDGKLSDELVRIPLVVRVPGAAPGRSDALVSGIDLMPSLFEWLGIPSSEQRPAMQGVSLVPLTDGRAGAVRTHAFMQTTRKGWTTPRAEMRRRVTAVRTVDRKLIWIPAEAGAPARREGYDLVADPGEQRDLYPSAPERFADLEAARHDWDADNRRTAAALVLPAGRAHASRQREAVAEGDLLGALHAYRRLLLLEDTWGLEEHPFFEHEEAGASWRSLRRDAGSSFARAVSCEARGLSLECVE